MVPSLVHRTRSTMGCRPHLVRIGEPFHRVFARQTSAPSGADVPFVAEDGQHGEAALRPFGSATRTVSPASRAEQRLADRRGERDLRCALRRGSAADELVLGLVARVVADANDGPEARRALAGGGGIDDGGGRDQSLELSDLAPLDRRVLEDRQVVVVVDRGSVGARVSESLGEVGAVRLRSESNSRMTSVRSVGLSSTPPVGAANCEGNCGSVRVS